jgi:hypothetical protein
MGSASKAGDMRIGETAKILLFKRRQKCKNPVI